MVLEGTCPHGKVLFAAVNEPSIIRPQAKRIAEMLVAGFAFKRVTGPVRIGGDCAECARKAPGTDEQQAEMFG